MIGSLNSQQSANSVVHAARLDYDTKHAAHVEAVAQRRYALERLEVAPSPFSDRMFEHAARKEVETKRIAILAYQRWMELLCENPGAIGI